MRFDKMHKLKEMSEASLKRLCERPSNRGKGAVNRLMRDLRAAQEIVDAVHKEGDVAVRRFTKKFDGVEMDSPEVTIATAREARAGVGKLTERAVKRARQNIEKFHKAQMQKKVSLETMPGVKCFADSRPIDKVGLYIPGGTAPLPSTVLMLAVPAKLAGCRQVIMATPPDKKGKIDPAILYAADQAGVDKIFKIGGAQAIAAMAFGTKTVPKVDKIFGPGNRYVTAAKLIVSNLSDGAAIDMPAGPTELLVIADENARPDFVASDILSQAEHGEDSQVLLATTSESMAKKVGREVRGQLSKLPREKIAEVALDNSFTVLTDTLDEAVEFANIYAPEHLILNVKKPKALVPKVMNAGSVFLGPYSCEAAGDYASGTNHTLPTYGYARAYSGVSVASFQKRITFQEINKTGARALASTVTRMAELEGLEGHKRAMEIRLEDEQ